MITVSEDFSKFPFGRSRKDGAHSGEAFRDDHLIPALKAYDQITVVLDGTAGLGSSFLEESFGGLVRNGYSSDLILKRINFVSNDDPSYIEEIIGYLKEGNGARS